MIHMLCTHLAKLGAPSFELQPCNYPA